jgi:hypothetical protein
LREFEKIEISRQIIARRKTLKTLSGICPRVSGGSLTVRTGDSGTVTLLEEGCKRLREFEKIEISRQSIARRKTLKTFVRNSSKGLWWDFNCPHG